MNEFFSNFIEDGLGYISLHKLTSVKVKWKVQRKVLIKKKAQKLQCSRNFFVKLVQVL